MRSKGIIFVFILILVVGGWFFYQNERESRYVGQSIIPERTDDIPLYDELKHDGSPAYVVEGNHWEEVLNFYKKELPENGWTLEYIHSSGNDHDDGTGFMSTWRKPGQGWELSIDAGYFQSQNRTEVIFDKRKILTATTWIENSPEVICINEQPDRSEDCFRITDKQTIEEIVKLVNSANDWEKDPILYQGKSTMNFGTFTVEVYYDLDKGIYLVSNKGIKWMKPEQEFFEQTRISKEY